LVGFAQPPRLQSWVVCALAWVTDMADEIIRAMTTTIFDMTSPAMKRRNKPVRRGAQFSFV
jgi:hypothetical protein